MADDEFRDVTYTVTLTLASNEPDPDPSALSHALYVGLDVVTTPDAILTELES